MLTKEELAKILDGREYGDEITDAEIRQAKLSGLVVVFGYSDDNVELRGAVDDEMGAYGGTTLHFDKSGLMLNKCPDEDCPYFQESLKNGKAVKVIEDRDGYSWVYETEIPHATFEIIEEGDKYCRGIVFSLADVQ